MIRLKRRAHDRYNFREASAISASAATHALSSAF
jgi:hypothetical protein